jgi:hypothetical protein
VKLSPNDLYDLRLLNIGLSEANMAVSKARAEIEKYRDGYLEPKYQLGGRNAVINLDTGEITFQDMTSQAPMDNHKSELQESVVAKE